MSPRKKRPATPAMASPVPPPRPKTITDSSLIGQRGVNLIERVVLDMSCVWHPTNAGLEAGIDGFIELREAATGHVLNTVVQVQSRATVGVFDGETADSLSYTCNERDLRYWLGGNAPVILVRSRPESGEAYWVSIKDYFADPARRSARRIEFDKRSDRFDSNAKNALFRIALSRDAGIYEPPVPAHEELFANLLPISRLPSRLFLAETAFRDVRLVFEKLRSASTDSAPSAWTFVGNRILSAADLGDPIWKDVVDRGTIEDFAVTEWADSSDSDRTRDFVKLLNRCLTERMWRLRVRWDNQLEHYFFSAPHDLSARTISYRSVEQKSSRVVFGAYEYKDEARRQAGKPAYYRHSALSTRIRRFGDRWHLVLSPTYRFTTDGFRVHPFYESKLKGIKALENNQTVLGQVAMWSSLLADAEADLFSHLAYPHLGFSPLRRGTLDVGVNDESWTSGNASQPEDGEATTDSGDDAIPLFDEAARVVTDTQAPMKAPAVRRTKRRK